MFGFQNGSLKIWVCLWKCASKYNRLEPQLIWLSTCSLCVKCCMLTAGKRKFSDTDHQTLPVVPHADFKRSNVAWILESLFPVLYFSVFLCYFFFVLFLLNLQWTLHIFFSIKIFLFKSQLKFPVDFVQQWMENVNRFQHLLSTHDQDHHVILSDPLSLSSWTKIWSKTQQTPVLCKTWRSYSSGFVGYALASSF